MKTNTHPRITLPAVTPNEFNALLAGLRALQYLLDTDTLPPDIRAFIPTAAAAWASPTSTDSATVSTAPEDRRLFHDQTAHSTTSPIGLAVRPRSSRTPHTRMTTTLIDACAHVNSRRSLRPTASAIESHLRAIFTLSDTLLSRRRST